MEFWKGKRDFKDLNTVHADLQWISCEGMHQLHQQKAAVCNRIKTHITLLSVDIISGVDSVAVSNCMPN